jgi:hypothetical protein
MSLPPGSSIAESCHLGSASCSLPLAPVPVVSGSTALYPARLCPAQPGLPAGPVVVSESRPKENMKNSMKVGLSGGSILRGEIFITDIL